VAVLGSTGSIGQSTLEVLEHHGEAFAVTGLVAGSRVERLAEQVRRWRPAMVAVRDEAAARQLEPLLEAPGPAVLVGPAGAARVAVESGAEIVVAAVVGAAGVQPTLAALAEGRTVCLANKEALVTAGELMLAAAERSAATLLPVDSEHNAIHQCLRAGRPAEVRRIVLTASGGPFRGRTARELHGVTARDALDHPTWNMGPKITVDSATLMNKGLEVIEARWLFGFGPEQIDVVVHPQSVVHSLVEFVDGSLVAQLGRPDMRHPIQYALTWPERSPAPVDRLDLAAVGTLSFEEPDRETFRCLPLAYRALREGGDTPARLNAANEVAVEAFLAGGIEFLDIPRVLEAVLDRRPAAPLDDLEAVLAADREAREAARELIRAREADRR
jgi:1-deoxy-D-xylulose-5-phosphate reductoisomerase